MKVKIKARMVVEVEYEADSEKYGCSTVEEMVVVDKANFEDDPVLLVTDDRAAVTIFVEGAEV